MAVVVVHGMNQNFDLNTDSKVFFCNVMSFLCYQSSYSVFTPWNQWRTILAVLYYCATLWIAYSLRILYGVKKTKTRSDVFCIFLSLYQADNTSKGHINVLPSITFVIQSHFCLLLDDLSQLFVTLRLHCSWRWTTILIQYNTSLTTLIMIFWTSQFIILRKWSHITRLLCFTL